MSDKSETESPVAEFQRSFKKKECFEAILFASAEPVSVAEFRARIQIDFNVRSALQRLMKHYEGRGVKVVRVGDAWAMRTAEDLSFLMKKETRRQRRLSQAAMENACDHSLSPADNTRGNRRNPRSFDVQRYDRPVD